METVEQLSQTGAALLNKYPLIIPFNSALGLQPEQLTHRGAFTPELESSIKTTPWLEPIAGDRLKPNPLNANGLIDTTQQTAAGSKTVRVDPLTGIARGAALACTTEKTVSLSKGESVLDAAINRADQQLKLFTADPDFLDKMQQAFGEDWQPQTALKLVPQVAGEAMRKIEVLPTSVLSANGAFGRGKIYLSEKFLSENFQKPEVVSGVLLEEIGHAVDQALNRVDSPGDEGNIFSRLIQDEKIDSAELETLKAEDDSATIALQGQAIAVELSLPANHLLKYTPGAPLKYDDFAKQWQQRMKDRGWNIAVDGLYGARSKAICIAFQKEKGLTPDGIVGPKTWDAAFRTDNLTPSPNPIPPTSPAPGELSDYSALEAKPARESINQGLTSPSAAVMQGLLGTPGALTENCSSVTNSNLKRLIVTQNVGPFTATGLKPAIETLRDIFAAVQREKPKLFSQLGSAGMLCVRKVRGGSSFSNHSWGTAVDVTINNRLDTYGDNKTQVGLKVLYSYFHKAGFYWGAGFSRKEDSMHFEASKELVEKWKSQNRL
ncbi:M15 family metallopeptidase [Phormidium tenue FACHB-886]|nr:M15 family metallopeptidase [Phormidium tenue FACHB-886]